VSNTRLLRRDLREVGREVGRAVEDAEEVRAQALDGDLDDVRPQLGAVVLDVAQGVELAGAEQHGAVLDQLLVQAP
jgi:hypothetical protein